jgi:hypothetical protein
MTDKPGRGTNPFDPTAERVEELKPGHDDAVVGHAGRHDTPGRHETPRRYDEPLEDNEPAMPSDDSTLKTQI